MSHEELQKVKDSIYSIIEKVVESDSEPKMAIWAALSILGSAAVSLAIIADELQDIGGTLNMWRNDGGRRY